MSIVARIKPTRMFKQLADTALFRANRKAVAALLAFGVLALCSAVAFAAPKIFLDYGCDDPYYADYNADNVSDAASLFTFGETLTDSGGIIRLNQIKIINKAISYYNYKTSNNAFSNMIFRAKALEAFGRSMADDALADALAAMKVRIDDAAASDEPLTAAERGAKAGLTNRQVTLR